mmetsp:Transcript_5190/g.15116  ORF Transcript_5190/g.15116 Transcript_5190/m.15116 type:complete len:439 (+) Transcript_5190:33-1349(+)
MTNNKAVSKRIPRSVAVAVFLLCVNCVTAFQSAAPFLAPHASSIVADRTDGCNRINCKRALPRRQCRRGQVFRAAADVTAMDDFFPPAEVFFPPPDVPEDAVTESDRIQDNMKKRFRRMKERLKSGRKRRAFKKMFLYPTKAMVRKPMRKVNDAFASRHRNSNHDNSNGTVNHSTNSMASAVAPEAKESTNLVDDIPDIVALASAVSEETESSVATPEDSAVKASAQAAMLAPITEEIVLPSETETPADVATSITPKGDRWAISAPSVDLSGKWELIVTNEFKRHYDRYLERLGQPKIVRSVALSAPVIGQTMEELIQIDCGRSLLIRGKNVRGTWDRTLDASGTTRYEDDYTPLKVSIRTVDGEQVESEAWWENEGTVHISWMRGVTMYGGGSFVSRRYLEETEDETVYVCESSFVFNDPKKEDNALTWKFRRIANN